MKKNILNLFVGGLITALAVFPCPGFSSVLAVQPESSSGATSAELSAPEVSGAHAEDSTEMISLDYKGADLGNVLRSLAQSHGLNLVAPKGMKGEVTMSLEDVTVDEALDAILTVNSYTYVRKGELIFVMAGPGLTNLEMKTVSIPLNYLAAADASALLAKVISASGTVLVNDTNNSLVITDFPGSLESIQKTLAEIDLAPVQVLIEAKLVDITEDDQNNWGFSFTDLTYDPGGTKGGLFDRKTNFSESLAGTQTMAGPSASLTGNQWTGDFVFKGLSGGVTIDALIRKKKARLLASPSIMTLNGKEANIVIGERYPYLEKTQTTTGTTETTKFVDIGTTLRVTPSVAPGGEFITMIVHPEVSSYKGVGDQGGPIITTRQADATVRVRDGQTIVIGGLIKRQNDNIRGRIPGVGNIPVLNWFFSNASADNTSTELVVFITPRIVYDNPKKKPGESRNKRDVAVNVEGTGERVLTSQLWNEANDLYHNEGIVSQRKDKDFRMAAAMDLYRQIAQQFPNDQRSDDALYRAAKIAYDYFKDPRLTADICRILIEDYPASPFWKKAQSLLKHSSKKMAKEEKKVIKRDRKTEKQEKILTKLMRKIRGFGKVDPAPDY